MLVRIQLERWLPDGCYYISLDGFSGQRQSTAPVRLRKEGSRSRLLKLVLFIVGGIGTISSKVWMHKARVWRAHREVIETIPHNRRGMFPVRFDLTVTSVKEFTVEANKLEKRNPIQADGIEG